VLRPVLHFFLLGAAGVLAVQVFEAHFERSAIESIVISQEDVAQLRAFWIAVYALPPDDAELAALIDRAVDEEVLHREALRLGLHRSDPVVTQRLVQNMRFVATDAAAGSDDALLREALELDMARRDVVVRRRLIERMTALLAAAAPEPSPEESRAFVRRHQERFSSSDKLRLSYRFESAEARDASPRPVRSGLFTERRLVRDFGAPVAAQLMRLEPGRWSDPFALGDGTLHARLEERIPGELPDPELALSRARLALARERRNRAVVDALAALRRRYAIEVAGAPHG
jgi:hypothetical protein